MATREGIGSSSPTDVTNHWRHEDGIIRSVDNDDPMPVKTGATKKLLNGYGPDVVVNGIMAAGTWDEDGDWAIGAGVQAHSGVVTNEESAQTVATLTAGTTYLVQSTITAYTSGTFAMKVGGQAGVSRTATGIYTEEITAKASGDADFATEVALACVGAFVGSVDNVVVREKFTDGTFAFTPLNAVEEVVFVEIGDAESDIDVYFKTTATQDGTALDAMTFNGRHTYMYDDDGELTHPVDVGATKEVTFEIGIDMSVVNTVSGPFHLNKIYDIHGSPVKHMNSKYYAFACTNVGGTGGDYGTILIYAMQR